MSIHRLTAGSGYDYLSRQVAAMDATDKGHLGLASYYTERGESPGVWVGSGMAGIDGLEVGDVVTADHMQALFASGHHPLANQRIKELDLRIGRPDLPTPTEADYKAASRLGTPYKVYENDVSAFRVEVAKRLAAINEAAAVPQDWPVPADQRAQVRTEVAREIFRVEHGRDPADARELAATIAKHCRPRTNAVAGYDLTFKPVKSVSTLWAVADPSTAASIERAHQAAMKDALDFIEQRALFTRMGSNGVRQVNVRGLVATAFTHRDSRAGEPLLHTHVAVANKAQTLDGKWLAIDGRILFKATVAASEAYNTALEQHLSDALGVRFEERLDRDARKRPVREIVGVHPALNARWSSRRQRIEVRRDELSAQFQRDHGRPPTPIETIKLSQQATLETRDAKHEPRTLAEQRAAWHTSAVEVLGSPRRLQQMIHGALNPKGAAQSLADSKWFARATDRIVDGMEGRRATWQFWHVYAEAQRQVRGAGVPTNQVPTAVNMLVGEVLDGHSVSLARPPDGVTEPEELRRTDGSSVYTVAGADLFTSRKVLDAEERLVAAAGRRDGYAVESTHVDLALLESEANGSHKLNAGQVRLVREMATSGARMQLAIAPAGSGKTTAMRAFAKAWSEGGGTVIGLAPSAAAADALRNSMGSQIDTQTDTLAKLTFSIQTGMTPQWVDEIGPSTVVVIDEAGMADTLSLDTAVQFILQRGGSVRVIGDDQQLAAIGAGGVLRDIRAQHGALQLTELVRFKDPAEGPASLALREGKPEALGFYLDRGRVQVGDLATMTDDVFSAWQADRAGGLDSIMLAPTRDLVGELNHRARAHRLEGADPSTIGPARALADGNQASVGDLIITRKNDRRLRTSSTDWVKNGDRWTILAISSKGDLTVQHTQHGRKVRLPADYVEASTDLGYACTVHTAQGVTADSMHGLATGAESRQQLYTMLTRGAIANHLYLQVVGDGDPHSVTEPGMVHPLTATDILESVLARDDAQQSATTLLREHADPAILLGEATQRYLDGLAVAAERTAGSDVVTALDDTVEQLLPGLAEEAAWPPLRAHLLLLAAHGEDPLVALRAAAGDRELVTAEDRAAVLDWRLDSTGMRSVGAGPLPWVPGIPARLVDDPHWGDYLSRRAELVTGLAGQVRDRAAEAATMPVWAQNGIRPDDTTLADVEVWRAAMQVAPDDRRPTGPTQLQKAAGTWQRRLNRRIAGDHTPALKEWSHLLRSIAPQISSDEFTPLLAQRLAAMSRAGLHTRELVTNAVAAGPLPDEHAAAALWWRMARHLTPAVTVQIGDHQNLVTSWAPRLSELLGAERAERIQASSLWPALVANIDHGLQRGWRLEDLLAAGATSPSDDVDDCQALVWRTSIALDPIPEDDNADYHYDEPPADMWVDMEPQPDAVVTVPPAPAEVLDHYHQEPPADAVDLAEEPHPGDLEHADDPDAAADLVDEDVDVERDLLLAAMFRDGHATTPEPTDADVRRMHERAQEWHHSPVPRERMVEINTLTQHYFEGQFTNSWGRTYLTERFGVDLAGHEHFRPGQAPAGWNNLVQHLRRHGVTDEEMLAAGVASEARTGRLIDRFRDRVMFPVVHRGEVLGFVGRRHPELSDADKNSGPKYLNTPGTPLFHKGAQLFGVVDELLDDDAVPVIVEGPMDALAVTLASACRHLGVAPLGTSLTDDQAAQLGAIGRDPVVATDADLAGQVAAERAFWMLTPHGLDPRYTQFPTGLDPADLLAQRGPAALAGALATSRPLGDQLLTERLDNLPPDQAAIPALQVLAARPGWAWDAGITQLRSRLQLSQSLARRGLRDLVKAWHTDPRKAAQNGLNGTTEARARLEAAAAKTPVERWASLATELDARLVDEGDWAATAALLQEAHDQGHDVATVARAMVEDSPLGEHPARDLRYRLVSRLDVTFAPSKCPPTDPHNSEGAAQAHQEGRRSQSHQEIIHR